MSCQDGRGDYELMDQNVNGAHQDELTTDNTNSKTDEASSNGPLETSPITKWEYFSLITLVCRACLDVADTVTDLYVMQTLWHFPDQYSRNYLGLFVVIDVMPGLMTVCQFLLRGYGLKSILLLVHSLNSPILTVLHLSGYKVPEWLQKSQKSFIK